MKKGTEFFSLAVNPVSSVCSFSVAWLKKSHCPISLVQFYIATQYTNVDKTSNTSVKFYLKVGHTDYEPKVFVSTSVAMPMSVCHIIYIHETAQAKVVTLA